MSFSYQRAFCRNTLLDPIAGDVIQSAFKLQIFSHKTITASQRSETNSVVGFHSERRRPLSTVHANKFPLTNQCYFIKHAKTRKGKFYRLQVRISRCGYTQAPHRTRAFGTRRWPLLCSSRHRTCFPTDLGIIFRLGLRSAHLRLSNESGKLGSQKLHDCSRYVARKKPGTLQFILNLPFRFQSNKQHEKAYCNRI